MFTTYCYSTLPWRHRSVVAGIGWMMSSTGSSSGGAALLDVRSGRPKIPEKHVDSLRLKQLAYVRRLTSIIILTSIMNAAIVLFCFRGTPATGLLEVWAAVILVLNVVTVFANAIWSVPAGRTPQRPPSISIPGLPWPTG